MAIIANTYLTYDTQGKRQDLADVISRVAPEETPVVSNSKKGSVHNTFFEWQTQDLAAPVTTGQLSGDQVAPQAVTPTVQLGNYQMITARPFAISASNEKIKAAGRASETNYQKILKGLEARRDQEASVLANQGAVAGNATTARRTGSLLAFIKTNTSVGTGGANPVYTNIPTASRTDGTQRAFTLTLLNTVMSSLFTQSGSTRTRVLLVNSAQKIVASTFTGIATRTYNLNEGSRNQAVIVNAADVLVTDFGVLEITLDPFMRQRDALVLDYDYISIDTLRPMHAKMVPAAIDGEMWWVGAEWGLRVDNEKALGGVFDLT